MKIIDQIAINRLLSLITNFILGILKIIAPAFVEDVKKPERKIWKPRWRVKDE